MRAIHKYNPKTREGARRIAQSMGYKFTIYDMPASWFNLMDRAGIRFYGVDYADPLEHADTETLKL